MEDNKERALKNNFFLTVVIGRQTPDELAEALKESGFDGETAEMLGGLSEFLKFRLAEKQLRLFREWLESANAALSELSS